jgi:hypothetical protein
MTRVNEIGDDAVLLQQFVDRHPIPSYVSQLCHRWQSFIAAELPECHADIVIRRYSLNSELAPRLADLGVEYGISRERVRQLELAGMKRLRSRRRRQVLQQIALEVAYEVTGLPPEKMLKPMDATQGAILPVAKNASHAQDEQDLGAISDEPTEQEESLADKEWVLPEYVIAARQKHPKAYARWPIEEEERLRELFSGGMDITALASVFERQPSAIRARLTMIDT